MTASAGIAGFVKYSEVGPHDESGPRPPRARSLSTTDAVQRMASADPGGELLRLVEQLAPQARPRTQDGVWFSKDGARALLVAQTVAPASDIDAQQNLQTGMNDC